MTPATSPAVKPDAGVSVTFSDGLGQRVRLSDGQGNTLDMLRIRGALSAASGFDFALRERVSRLANFRHAYYARVRRVDRLDDGATVGVVAEAPDGARLAHILEVASARQLDLDVNAALCLLRQIVPAVAMLHQNARDVSHGAIAPERIVVTANARIMIVDYVLGAAIESLGYSRERLWKELRVAVPSGAGTARLNHRADVMQMGVVALALVLGRPLGEDDLRELPALLASARENSGMGDKQPISDSLRRWLSRALQLDAVGSFESALEAQLALDDVLAGDAGYIAAPIALESFLAQYHECAASMPVVQPALTEPEPEIVATRVEPAPTSEAPTSKINVLPSTPRLGVAKVTADAPAVPSFRAVAVPPQPIPVVSVQPRVEAEEVQAFNGSELPGIRSSSRDPEEPIEKTADRNEFDDEEALRAKFLEASAASGTVSEGIPGWWRAAALGLAVIAIAEGAFIGWGSMSVAGAASGSGTLKVESKPAGAQVTIDGEAKGATPLSVPIAAGAHVLEIAAGGEPRVIPITVNGGETLAQYIELGATPSLGRMSVQSSPAGATVLLDGQPRGTTPIELPDVTAGDHELVLDLNGQRVRQVITVAAGATATVNLPMAPGAGASTTADPPAPVPTSGQLLVQVPFEMQVFERGAQLGASSNRLSLTPGPHDLEIVSETLNFRTKARVDIIAGRTLRLPITLPKGTVHLNATPWAEVWVDGNKVGDTPIGNLPLTIGPHEVVFRHPQLGEQSHAATVVAGTPLRLSVDLTRKQ